MKYFLYVTHEGFTGELILIRARVRPETIDTHPQAVWQAVHFDLNERVWGDYDGTGYEGEYLEDECDFLGELTI